MSAQDPRIQEIYSYVDRLFLEGPPDTPPQNVARLLLDFHLDGDPRCLELVTRITEVLSSYPDPPHLVPNDPHSTYEAVYGSFLRSSLLQVLFIMLSDQSTYKGHHSVPSSVHAKHLYQLFLCLRQLLVFIYYNSAIHNQGPYELHAEYIRNNGSTLYRVLWENRSLLFDSLLLRYPSWIEHGLPGSQRDMHTIVHRITADLIRIVHDFKGEAQYTGDVAFYYDIRGAIPLLLYTWTKCTESSSSQYGLELMAKLATSGRYAEHVFVTALRDQVQSVRLGLQDVDRFFFQLCQNLEYEVQRSHAVYILGVLFNHCPYEATKAIESRDAHLDSHPRRPLLLEKLVHIGREAFCLESDHSPPNEKGKLIAGTLFAISALLRLDLPEYRSAVYDLGASHNLDLIPMVFNYMRDIHDGNHEFACTTLVIDAMCQLIDFCLKLYTSPSDDHPSAQGYNEDMLASVIKLWACTIDHIRNEVSPEEGDGDPKLPFLEKLEYLAKVMEIDYELLSTSYLAGYGEAEMCCHNPDCLCSHGTLGCVNMKKCPGCKDIYYCNPTCQAKDFEPNHRKQCTLFRQESEDNHAHLASLPYHVVQS